MGPEASGEIVKVHYCTIAMFTLLYHCCFHITVPLLFSHYCAVAMLIVMCHHCYMLGSQCSCQSTESDQVSYTPPHTLHLVT